MTIANKVAHRLEAAKGSVKKRLGRATGDSRLRAEGRTDQAFGRVKLAGDNVSDAFKH